MMSAEGEESWLMKEGAWCFFKKVIYEMEFIFSDCPVVVWFILLISNKELLTVKQGVYYLTGLAFCLLAGQNIAKLREN